MATPSEVDLETGGASTFKDRSGGLIVFGFLLLGLSLCCASMILLMVLVYFVSASSGAPQPVDTLAMNMVTYGGGTLLLFTLGIGSIRACRWARAITLVTMASVFAVGVVSLLVVPVLLMNFTLPMPPEVPEGGPEQIAVKYFMIAGIAIFLGIQMLLPLPFILFFRSPHVKATCEWRHPQPSWTDACPLPVLALVLWLAYSCATCAVMGFTMPAVPWLDGVVTGPAATVILLGFALVAATLSWGLYRLKMGAWWGLLVLVVFGSAVAGYTMYSMDFMEYMAAMDLPAEQLEMMRDTGISDMYQQPSFFACMGLVFLLYLGFVVWTRKFFKAASA